MKKKIRAAMTNIIALLSVLPNMAFSSVPHMCHGILPVLRHGHDGHGTDFTAYAETPGAPGGGPGTLFLPTTVARLI